MLQVVFHAQIASETERFDIQSVARKISEKMIRRHPHVFADSDVKDADGVLKQWEEIKKTERSEDLVTLSIDSKRLVIDENRSASDAQLMDLKKAEEELLNIKRQIQEDEYAAAEIHQLNEKRVLFLSLDVQ